MKKILWFFRGCFSLIVSTAVCYLPIFIILEISGQSGQSFVILVQTSKTAFFIFLIIVVFVSIYLDSIYKKKILKITNEVKNFENGDVYEGEMRNGKMQGKGTYTFSSGERYEGEFNNNMFEGKGVYFYTDGSKKVGFFKNDELIK